MVAGQKTGNFPPRNRQWKYLAMLFVLLIALSIGFDIMGRRVIDAARVRTERLYTALLAQETSDFVPGLNEYVAKDLKRIEAELGPLVSFEVSRCTAQVTMNPSLCKVVAQRKRGKSIETVHWYDGKCLKIGFEAPA